MTSLCPQTWAETLEGRTCEWGDRCLHATPRHSCHSCRGDLGLHRCYSSRMRTCCCQERPHPSASSSYRHVTPTKRILFETGLTHNTHTWWTAHSGWTLVKNASWARLAPVTSRHVSNNLVADKPSPEFWFHCRDWWLSLPHLPCHSCHKTQWMELRLLRCQGRWRSFHLSKMNLDFSSHCMMTTAAILQRQGRARVLGYLHWCLFSFGLGKRVTN